MKRLNATLVILTRNEINGLRILFDTIPCKSVKEVFAIDYKSADGTVEFFKKKGIRVIRQEKKGRAEAFRIGCALAKHENVVFFSPDGNEMPSDIPKLIYWLEHGYDMAIASRFTDLARAEDERLIPIRGFGNRFFTVIINLIWRGKLTDSINGFRAIKRSKFLLLSPDTEGFGIEFQLSIRALKKNFRIKEIPTIESNRIGGQSTAHTFPTGWLFMKIIARELWLGKNFKK